MREERGKIAGDLVIYEPYELWGSITGNVRVIDGGKVYVRGNIYGDLDVQRGGRVHVFGNVSGRLTVHREAKVIHSGVVGGDAVNLGGRLYVDHAGRVVGKVRHKSGETRIDPKSPSHGQQIREG